MINIEVLTQFAVWYTIIDMYLRGAFNKFPEAVTKVIDTLTQEDFHGAFQKVLERYSKCIAPGGDYFERD